MFRTKKGNNMVPLGIICFLFAYCQCEISVRIVGGYEFTIEEFPFMAVILSNGVPFCGASIISYDCVLTAGHCIAELIDAGVAEDRTTILVGSTFNSPEFGQVHQIKAWIIHSEYTSTFENDIALIKIHGSFNFTENVQPISIFYENIQPGVLGVISGWGETNQMLGRKSIFNPRPLKAANVLIISLDDCKEAYRDIENQILETNICAGFPSGEVDACQGDSGGPLTYHKKLIGIISFGMGCNDKRYPGVYTRVSMYGDWIFYYSHTL